MSLADLFRGSKAPFGVPTGTPPIAPPIDGSDPSQAAPHQGGIGGFLDRVFNPTNGLGMFGQALIAANGDPGQAMQFMMQQRAATAKAGPHIEHVGDQIGIVDPRTGQFTPTYTPPKAPTGFDAELIANGIDPNSDEGRHMKRQKLDNGLDPYVTFSGQQGSYFGPRSGLPGALGVGQGSHGIVPEGVLGAPVGKITPIDGDPFAGGAGGNASGGFPSVR